MNNKITKVAVVGAGTMGQGIAQSVAMAGYQVMLYDVDQQILDKGMSKITANLDKGIDLGKVSTVKKDSTLQNMNTTTDLNKVLADLVIEAVVEDLKIKQDLFLKLESINQNHTIFATNTSSIPVTRIGSKLKFPNRLAGLHFFNPAHIMKLVEVIQGTETDPQVTTFLTDFG